MTTSPLHAHDTQPNRAQSGEQVRDPRIIAVASGKGGVGKTWFSTNFAHALAFRGRRILVFDGDLGLANVDVQLGITPSRDLASVVAGEVAMADAVSAVHGGAGSGRGFDVLAGRSGSGTLSLLRREELVDLAIAIKRAAGSYDHVIIDLAAGIDSAVTTLSALSDMILVVVTDEPTSLTDAYAFIKVSLMRDADADVRVVVNMADSISEGRRTFEALSNACRNFLKAEPRLAGILPRDSKVKEAIRRQSLLQSAYPQAPAVKALESLCAQVFPAR